MNKKAKDPTYSLYRFKELIITTIICLFLTGIYDSINSQTEEIKKWYQLMVSIQAEQQIQTNSFESLEESFENHFEETRLKLLQHDQRIKELETNE